MKIFITGGHLTPALAVIDELIKREGKIYFIGIQKAQEEDTSDSVEYQTLKKYESVVFLKITTGKLQRYLNLYSLKSILKIPVGFIQSFIWLIKYKPDLVLSFGGYVAIPVVITAYMLRIPVITHEQTRVLGLSNRIISKLAKYTCITWPSTKTNKKTILTGLPLRKLIFKEIDKLPINLDKPLLYITGGSVGSHAVNVLIEPIIGKLLKDFSVIHQIGSTVKFNDFSKFTILKSRLDKDISKRYLPIEYIEENFIGWVYKNVKIAVGRSGANTVIELAVNSIPAIFIPLPFAGYSEQKENALFFKTHKAGKVLDQNKLEPETLYREIMDMNNNYKTYKEYAKTLKNKITPDGVNNILRIIDKITS